MWNWLRRLLIVGLGVPAVSIAYVLAEPSITKAVFFWQSPSPAEVVEWYRERYGAAGAVLATGTAGGKPMVLTFGTTRSGVPMPPDQVFRIASLSKPLTATAVLEMVKDQTLGLDDQLATFIPEVANAADPRFSQITIRHLLQHSAGWSDPIRLLESKSTCAEAAAASLTRPLDFDPGAAAVYSNLGYCWLDVLIARVNGSYEGFVKESVLGPAKLDGIKMGSAAFGAVFGWAATAEGYFEFISTVAPPVSSQRVIIEPDLIPYGLGWFLDINEDSGSFGHAGRFPGAISVAVRTSEDRIAVAILNHRPPQSRRILIALMHDLARALSQQANS